MGNSKHGPLKGTHDCPKTWSDEIIVVKVPVLPIDYKTLYIDILT